MERQELAKKNVIIINKMPTRNNKRNNVKKSKRKK